MPQITTTQVRELVDPELRALAGSVVRTARLAAEKAVAHNVDPSAYPLPEGSDSLEHLFLARFRQMPATKQETAKARVLPSVRADSRARFARYGSLSAVNLHLATPIREQVKALPTVHALAASLAGRYAGLAFFKPDFPPAALDKIELRVHKVRCIDETGAGYFGEWGADDISLGGSSVNAIGKTAKIPPYTVGDFDDGDQVTHQPPRRFATFDLRQGDVWPKSYFVTFALVEEDMGGYAEFLNKLVDKVRDDVEAYLLAAAIGGGTGSLVGPLGTVIGAAVGYAVGMIIDYLKDWWGDDVFEPETAQIDIPKPSMRWAEGKTDSPQEVVVFKGHDGEYQITYDWRIYK